MKTLLKTLVRELLAWSIALTVCGCAALAVHAYLDRPPRDGLSYLVGAPANTIAACQDSSTVIIHPKAGNWDWD